MSSEKVTISQDKPYIILEGESRSRTVILWGDFGSSLESSTFMLYADNFMARGITFKVKLLKIYSYKMCVWITFSLKVLFIYLLNVGKNTILSTKTEI